MIGKILGNRYRVVEKIGDGGTAFVFRGLDSLLNRSVTIKVLRPEYVSDQDFVRRFRREAQAAASLSHPNIVSIYDVGFEEGIHYIVMEFIKGQSLKELVEDMGNLPLRMAADYASQIAHALAHAHRHGIVHRDVKPHNILINEEGRIKVTDFGIAQAVTAATVTYNGSILGSVHYFSPEQARGGQTNEKSDIYSLGVVLYEMLTGSVPYEGDSPVSVALKHIQEPFPDPRQKNTEIPSPILQVIRRAVEKDPLNRYGTAREMAEELNCWMLDKPVRQASLPPVREVPAATPVTKKKNANAWRVVAIIFIALLAVGLVAGILQLKALLVVPEVEVPLVEGESGSRAAKILEEAGLKPRIVDEMPDEEVPAGHVIMQRPAAGRKVKQNRDIELTISTGPVLVEVPGVAGKTELEATLMLQSLGFDFEVQREFSEQVPGTVTRQDPGEGFKLAKGSKVTLTVSKGGRPFAMKNLVGITLEDARELIELYGLSLRFVEYQENAEYGPGLIFSQFPEAGVMVQAGDPVDLVVSKETDTSNLQPYEIRIPTAGIPVGEKVTVTVSDALGVRTQVYDNGGDVIVTMGWGRGEYEYRWSDRVERRTFP